MAPRDFFYSVGGRKYLAWFTLLVASSIFLTWEKIDGAQWVDLMKWTSSTLIVAIGAEGIAEKVKNGEGDRP